ncbi:pyridoxal 5'-phosphate synthase glutaminase subunit PdxT [Arabiibacter massiliensis]|uniref:pyridoxal 5'-phosphate synthase glutaminase subunit PdxT n=1 Tax=Arabiibacter massiliensis TaxID=1870985 RepID=UPI0009BC1C65|nr:pyridoxal 5'-phosphate synthase glutaminase subunit PdxT [Arabiibacter massiliensis]
MGTVVAVLAVQGAFVEHERKLDRLGATCFELRQRADLERPFDALVLPGGESTVQGRLLRELGMLEPLRERIEAGLPVLATCAGMILLAERIEPREEPHLATMPITVRRNAYGRQLESFRTHAELAGVGQVPCTFIRAPYVEAAGPGVEVLACVDGNTVAARHGNQWALAFHPELDASDAVHAAFLASIRHAPPTSAT